MKDGWLDRSLKEAAFSIALEKYKYEMYSLLKQWEKGDFPHIKTEQLLKKIKER